MASNPFKGPFEALMAAAAKSETQREIGSFPGMGEAGRGFCADDELHQSSLTPSSPSAEDNTNEPMPSLGEERGAPQTADLPFTG